MRNLTGDHNHTSNAIEITAHGTQLGHNRDMNDTKGTNKMVKVIGYVSVFTYTAVCFSNPFVGLIAGIALISAAGLMDELRRQDQERAIALATLKAAYERKYEVIEVTNEPEVAPAAECVEDPWSGVTEVTDTATAPVLELGYQLCLPAGIETEVVEVAAFSEFTYKELQAKCKELRKSAQDIKINSKRDVLENWLAVNS